MSEIKEMERIQQRIIQQRIYLSRKSLNSIEFEYDVLKIPLKAGEETSFELLVINHGGPTHVHFSLSRGIKDKLLIMQDKVYVIDEEKIAAIVRLPKSYAGAVAAAMAGSDSDSAKDRDRGEIFISTGYGATKRSFPVEIVEVEAGARARVETEIVPKERGTSGERELNYVKSKTRRKFTISVDERAFLSRLVVSVSLAILFLVLLFLILHTGIFSDLPGYLFAVSLIAALLFLFIVIYNI
ncbi:MAG: hypothetical protein H0M93_04550 [Methanophagales archaeon]|nr:hypothetical protein [Methanophagales archaeon]